MAPDALEREIRTALQAEASACPVPKDLAERTLARALQAGAPDGGRLPSGRPRLRPLLYAGATAAAVLAFFVVGSRLTLRDDTTARAPSTGAGPTGPTQLVEPEGGPTAPSPEPDEGSRPSLPDPVPGGPPAPSGPLVARMANLEVQVDEGRFSQAWAQAEAVAARFGGDVVTSSAQEVEDRLARGSLTLQVPADRLDAVLQELRRLGTPKRQTASATDVSGQLVDYEARLRAAQASEAQLLELLKQARSVQDNLAVRPRLDEVRREIETLQARRASLQGRVAMASVSAVLYERDAGPSDRSEGRIGQALRRAVDAAGATVAGMVVAAGYLGPVLVVAAGLALLVRTVRRRRLL